MTNLYPFYVGSCLAVPLNFEVEYFHRACTQALLVLGRKYKVHYRELISLLQSHRTGFEVVFETF